MSRFIKLTSGVIAALMIAGCVNKNITREDAGNLEKGMNIRVAEAVLQKPSQDAFLISDDAEKYLVKVYGLASGDHSSRYFLVFDTADKLFYWGFRDEFTRASDPRLNRIGQQLR